MNVAEPNLHPQKSGPRSSNTSLLPPSLTPRSPETFSLPGADPRSARPRCGGRECHLPAGKPRRLLWVVNHRTLMPAEVPILRSLGWEVFVPKIIPSHDTGYRSGAISYEYDSALMLPKTALRVLNHHKFYEQPWSATVEDIINEHFSAIIVSFSFYTMPLHESVHKFSGVIIARTFGREHPRTYTELAEGGQQKVLMSDIGALGDRFIFGQAYNNLAEVEARELRCRAHTITVPLPSEFYRHSKGWRGGCDKAIFLCPSIQKGSYYGDIYDGIKRDFGDLPHVIFGRQVGPVDDPAVMPYLSDEDLVSLYATAPVFVYPHTEPRHVHYSPLEAMIIGTPTLYMRGALIDQLTGSADLPGACRDIEEMREKTKRLLNGDANLAEAIRAAQVQVIEYFSSDLARSQWAAVLTANATRSAEDSA
jgi:hypothetical protein